MRKIDLVKFLDDDNNYKLLHKWCSQKSIYEWFEQRLLSYDEIKDKYKNKLLKNEHDMFLITYDNNPIGYAQIYKSNDSYEYDLFIGEEDCQSKGIGSQVVRIINDMIFNQYGAHRIILRPFKRNVRAVKCYEKNGFRIIDEYDDKDTLGNDEKYLLMINEKNNM